MPIGSIGAVGTKSMLNGLTMPHAVNADINIRPFTAQMRQINFVKFVPAADVEWGVRYLRFYDRVAKYKINQRSGDIYGSTYSKSKGFSDKERPPRPDSFASVRACGTSYR